MTGNGSFGGLATGPVGNTSGFASNQSRTGGGFGGGQIRDNSGDRQNVSSGNDTSGFDSKIKAVSLNDTGPLGSQN